MRLAVATDARLRVYDLRPDALSESLALPGETIRGIEWVADDSLFVTAHEGDSDWFWGASDGSPGPDRA